MTGAAMPGDMASARDLSEATPYLVGVFRDADAPFSKGDFYYDGRVIPNPYALFHPSPEWQGKPLDPVMWSI